MTKLATDPAPCKAATDTSFLHTWLLDRDEPCPLCGYNLRGLTSPRCPECGQALRLSLTLSHTSLKAWIALVAAVLPPAGVGFIFTFLVCYDEFYGGRVSIHELRNVPLAWAVAALHTVSCLPLSIAVIVFRRRFLGLRPWVQNLTAIFAWLAVVGSILILLSQIR